MNEEKQLEDKVIEKVDEKIQHIVDEDINTTNLEYLYKLSKIRHMTKEDKEMYGEYGNYGRGRRPGYDSYGRGDYRGYDTYRERGRDMRYRGHDHLDRMYDEYGRYNESRSRYGASEETDKSYHYMVKALEDFIRVLYEEADNEQQKNMLRETLQRSMM